MIGFGFWFFEMIVMVIFVVVVGFIFCVFCFGVSVSLSCWSEVFGIVLLFCGFFC